jgi:membrane-associated phospholipid phosphatase
MRPVRTLAISALALVLLTVLVATGWSPLLRLDRDVAARLHEVALDHPGLVRAADIGETVLSPTVFRGLVVVLAVWLLWRGQARLAFWAVLAMTVGGLAGILGKLLLARPRPQFTDAVGHATGYGYPSGHAINAALGVLVILAIVLPRIRHRAAAIVFGALVVILTSLDRMVLGVHYLTDVVGACLAALVVVAATALAWPPRQGRSAGVAS